MRVLRWILVLLVLVGIAAGAWIHLATTGHWGERQIRGEISTGPRDTAFVEAKIVRRSLRTGEKQVLFGDLHVHSTYSFDAYNISLPMYRGEGSHPPGDACDFARYCSGLDFWSINDHAEGMTPAQWAQTRDMVRECNAQAGDPAHPDMVTYLGWEWTQIGNTPEDHYGHKNVVLFDTQEGRVPVRPVSSREQLFPGGGDPYNLFMRLVLIAGAKDSAERQRYFDFIRFLVDREALTLCESGVPVRELPDNCQESAPTPTELFTKLDDWGNPYYVIPHGNSWGFYTPPRSAWDKQLKAHATPDKHEPLIEVFSGHGNIEQYKQWRAVRMDDDGTAYCPEPTENFLPECWRAGEIIRARCLAAGEGETQCEERAAATRANFILTKDSGHWTVPGATLEDWLDSGQCRDCYMPAYNHRPTSSMQYGLAISDFPAGGGAPKRYRWGVIGSSDVHTARPGTGYKEIMRRNMSDAALGLLGPPAFLTESEPVPEFATLEEVGMAGPNFSRFSSFFGTGGLVAVHSTGRDRQSIWDALGRKEVYGTSGDRILLWFDLLEGDERLPMGSQLERVSAPSFEVSAMGAFEQKPGCPADSLRAVAEDRLMRLCGGECYHPGDARKSIERIEVVRIRPQVVAGEDVGDLIEDPWLVLPCETGTESCTVQFSDPDFAAAGRDTLYYVRAHQSATPTVNGAQLRCEYDGQGQCIAVNPCYAGAPTELSDDCLADAEERAWSSPIFVDFAAE
ncbi:MAG: DUF3604 domain-containing protein [Halioglobus sp.]|nr:DUF3604 domain-containing protein [Halioglobus sp.]